MGKGGKKTRGQDELRTKIHPAGRYNQRDGRGEDKGVPTHGDPIKGTKGGPAVKPNRKTRNGEEYVKVVLGGGVILQSLTDGEKRGAPRKE